MKQQKFWKNPIARHGGAEAQGKRKSARVIVTKSPMHIVLKSQRARGEWNFLRHKAPIERKARGLARKYRVRVHHFVNVGNHLHLGVQASSRRELQNFLRVLPQAIAFLVTGTRKGRPIGRFWSFLAFTRVIQWGLDWRWMQNYFEKNRLEAEGMPGDRAHAILRDLWNSS